MFKRRFGGGQFLTHFGTHLLDIFEVMTQKAHLTNHWIFILQFFCNDIYLLQLQEHQTQTIM